MDFDDTEEDASFRREVSAWLEDHAEVRTGVADWSRNPAHPDYVRRCREWQHTLYEGGWGAITWPEEYGGRGETSWHQTIFNQEVAKYDVSVGAFAVGIGMAGPTLIAHGSEEQKRRQLPAMLRGEAVWCQLFSEPDAGSDLAGLKSRAEHDGESFVVNGQKVWTSGAQHSDWAILIARTNPDVPKHKGITYFLVDMRSPGIEVRPLRQITGTAHFNEVFLTDVVIPAANVVGEINGGWAVAHTTMSYERALIGGTGQSISIAQVAGSCPPLRQERGSFGARADCRFLHPGAASSVHELPRADGTFQGSSAWSRGFHYETLRFPAHGSERGTVHEPARRQRHVGRRRRARQWLLGDVLFEPMVVQTRRRHRQHPAELPG